MPSNDAPKGRVLIVAGSDSGGGAGIQADVKSVTMLGGFASTAITAVTIQNTLGVSGVIALEPQAVRAQMQAVLSDIGADVIKTGMLGEKRLVEALADARATLAKGVPCIVDPVMAASSGDRLLPGGAVDALRQLMVPGAALITPNAVEAEILTGKAVETLDGQRRAADRLLEMGALAALVKGGHVGQYENADMVDVLATHDGETFFDVERVRTTSTHGTGCTLASSISAGLARGLKLEEAIRLAHDYLSEALRRAPGLGKGNGPMDHAWPARDPERYSDMLGRRGLR